MKKRSKRVRVPAVSVLAIGMYDIWTAAENKGKGESGM